MSALDDRPQVLTALMHGYNRISESWAAVLADTDSAPGSPHMRWRDVPNGDPTMAWHQLLQGGESRRRRQRTRCGPIYRCSRAPTGPTC
jgi:hypothetical protein